MFTLILVNKTTGKFISLFEFFDYEQFIKDVSVITDTARSKRLVYTQLGMAILRNFDAAKAPRDFPISQIINLFRPSTSNHDHRNEHTDGIDAANDVWRVLCVEATWFQDLFNYDFRRTEMCVFPYGTQTGEISFCAYNAGIPNQPIAEKRTEEDLIL